MGLTHQSELGMQRFLLLAPLRRTVFTAIIHAYHLKILESLRPKAGKCLRETLDSIVHGDNNRNGRRHEHRFKRGVVSKFYDDVHKGK